MPCRCVCTRTIVCCSVFTGLLYGLFAAAVAEYVRLDSQPSGTTDLRYQRTVLIVVWTCLGLAFAQVFCTAAVLVCKYVRDRRESERMEEYRRRHSAQLQPVTPDVRV